MPPGSKPKRVQITARDVELFDFLERYRWASREQISRAITWSFKSLERRLKILMDSGHIDGWRADRYSPMYQAISNGGAMELARRRGLSVDKFYWRWLNKDFKPGNTEHAVLTTEVMVKLLEAARQHPTHTIIEQRDILRRLSPERQKRQHPFSISLDLIYKQEAYSKTVNPDQVFGVSNEENRVALFSLEADRRNHPVRRGSFENHGQVFPKLVTFFEIHNRKLFQDELGLKRMRQLWVVQTKDRKGTQDRIRNMQEQALIATEGQVPGLFLFGSAYDTAECDSLLDFEFENAAQQQVRLTD